MSSHRCSRLCFLVLLVAVVLFTLLSLFKYSSSIELAETVSHSLQSDGWTEQRLGPGYDAEVKEWIRDSQVDRCSVQKRNTSKCSGSSALPVCTLETLRKFVNEHDTFADTCYWATAGNQDVLCPSFCNFPGSVNHNWIHQKRCRLGRKPIKVMLFGSSTGRFLTEGLISAVEEWGFRCSTQKEEATIPGVKQSRDVEYFRVKGGAENHLLGSSSTIYRGGPLDTCFSKQCTPSTSKNNTTTDRLAFEIEYISYTNILESTLYLRAGPRNRSMYFSTFAEYVFRYYLREHGYPDLLIAYAQFHHLKWHASFSKAKLEIQYVNSLMETFIPTTTKILWLPGHLECQERIPAKFARNPHGDDLDSNQILHGLNHVLYEVLRPSLKNPKSNTFAFFDFAKISCPQTCVSHMDSVHMLPEYYAVIGSYILQLACA